MSIYRGKTTREVCLANLLYDAIDDENIDSINTFLKKGADCNLVLPKQGIAPFHLVIGKESEEFATNLATLFLQYKADPNVRTRDGLTPLHIAAAYGRSKILHSLLCCGGNPDLRDANYKKPIDYGYEYEHKECVNLLLSFMEKPNIFNRAEMNLAFNLILEKIVVGNGGHAGEYELIHEYKTESLTQKKLASLQDLPETDTTEYVRKWCQNHVQTTNTSILPESAINSSGNSYSNSDYNESSCYESDGGKSVTYNIKEETMKFRKKYTKVRKIQSSSKSKKSHHDKGGNYKCNLPVDSVDSSNITTEETNEMFSALKDFSKESGIMTLPNSKSDAFLTIDKNDLNSADANPTNTIPINIDNSLTNSSAYRTCSPCNDTNNHISLNACIKNTSDTTNDLMLIGVDEAKSRRSSTKSDGVCSTDYSFVSVSEVYKYIDEQEGIVLFEKRLLRTGTSDYAGSIMSSSLSSKLSSLPVSADYDTDTLRKELTSHGYNPGPITFTTKRVYLRKLQQIKRFPINQVAAEPTKKIYSVELEKTLRCTDWLKDASSYKALEDVLVNEFANPNPSRKWREGVNKTSFTYLLMDPRITNNLPCRAETMDKKDIWELFLSSIFYVGKGKRSRPYSHLYEAVNLWKQGKKHSPNKKLNQILNIWNDDNGVICLHIFQNVIPVEAYTREAAIISAMKLENLKNIKSGEFYGTVSTWTQRQKKMLGVYLLHKAMMIFINEGERQLCPKDIG